jgi:hypothetical protein
MGRGANPRCNIPWSRTTAQPVKRRAPLARECYRPNPGLRWSPNRRCRSQSIRPILRLNEARQGPKPATRLTDRQQLRSEDILPCSIAVTATARSGKGFAEAHSNIADLMRVQGAPATYILQCLHTIVDKLRVCNALSSVHGYASIGRPQFAADPIEQEYYAGKAGGNFRL